MVGPIAGAATTTIPYIANAVPNYSGGNASLRISFLCGIAPSLGMLILFRCSAGSRGRRAAILYRRRSIRFGRKRYYMASPEVLRMLSHPHSRFH